MADPKKNPLIGAFRAPVPGAPPDTPAPPEAGKPPAAGAAKDKGRGFHRPDLEAAPGRVSGGLDEAPDLQWHAAGLRGKSTLGEYLYERAGPVHGKAPGAIRQGRQAAVQQRLCQCQPPLCANQRTKRQKMEHHERRRTERRQSHAEEITGNPAIYPQSGANGPQLSQSSICPLRR